MPWRCKPYQLLSFFEAFPQPLQGFILASSQADVQGLVIAQLPPSFRLDTPWPMQKLPLRATPHRIAHIPECNVFALLLTKEVIVFRLCLGCQLLIVLGDAAEKSSFALSFWSNPQALPKSLSPPSLGLHSGPRVDICHERITKGTLPQVGL